MNKLFIIIIITYLFIYCFVFKQDYINVSQVIKKQLCSILKRKEERRKSDIYSFINIYIVPLFLAVLVAFDNILTDNFYNNILIILAILVSVFLTLISILTSKSYKSKTNNQKIIINLTFNNVYFLTIVSIILMILCFLKNSISNINLKILNIIPIINNIINTNNLKILFNTVVVYLIIEIIMHLLIVLKRIQQIFFITFDD